MFFKHLADASGTALMRLINITVTHYLSALKTVFPGVANGKQTVQWTFAVSSLRQQDRDGAIAASMFFKHLADASGTALMRLVIVFVIFLRLIDPLHSLSWFSSLLLYLLNIFMHYETDIGCFSLCCRSAEL